MELNSISFPANQTHGQIRFNHNPVPSDSNLLNLFHFKKCNTSLFGPSQKMLTFSLWKGYVPNLFFSLITITALMLIKLCAKSNLTEVVLHIY